MLPFDGNSPFSGAVMDNCSVHHADSVKELFRQASILLIFSPLYSTDLKVIPIELALNFAKVKRYLKENDEFVPDPLPIVKGAFNINI